MAASAVFTIKIVLEKMVWACVLKNVSDVPVLYVQPFASVSV
jgi:hypothetical protein